MKEEDKACAAKENNAETQRLGVYSEESIVVKCLRDIGFRSSSGGLNPNLWYPT